MSDSGFMNRLTLTLIVLVVILAFFNDWTISETAFCVAGIQIASWIARNLPFGDLLLGAFLAGWLGSDGDGIS